MGANAWADDDFTSEVYSEDFSGTPEGITYSMGGNNNTVSIDNGYLDYYVSTRTNGSPNLTFTNSNFSNLSEYKFVWDAAFGFGNTNATSLTLNADNTEKKMFTIDFTGGGSVTKDITISKADGTAITPDVALTIAGKQAVGPWVTFTLFVHDSKAYLTVKSQDGTTTYIDNVEVASAGHVSSITGSMGKGYNHINYDNLHLYKSASAVVVYAPSIAYSRVDGTKRYLTLTKDGNQEGNPTLYYRIGDEGDYTAYSGEFEVSSSATVYYYAELSGTSSSVSTLDVTCDEITLNAPTINVAYDASTNKYNAYFISNQTDKLITSDAVTYTYTTTSNPTPTACTSPVAVIVGEKVTVYANANGYTSASTAKETVALPFEIPSDLLVWNDVFTSGETLTADEEATFTVGGTSNLVPITAIGETALSGNVGFSSYTSARWQSTTNGAHPTNNYYLGIKGLSSGQLFKIVVTEETMLYNSLTNRKDVSSMLYVDNGDGTFSLYCLAGASAVAFNISANAYLRSIAAIGNAKIGATGYTTFASSNILNLARLPEGLTAYYASTVGESTVTFTSIEEAVPAGTGLLLKGTANSAYFIPSTSSAETLSGNKLVGCITSTPLAANENYYVMVNNGGTAEFQSLKSNGATIPAGKAYLNAASAGARLSISFYDETTGISTIENSDALNYKTYNLNGQRVKVPSNGLYIVNGKKVIIK